MYTVQCTLSAKYTKVAYVQYELLIRSVTVRRGVVYTWRKMEQPHSPNLSDLAECVILCTSWLQSPGKVSWICDLRTRCIAILGWLFSAELEILKSLWGLGIEEE